MVPFLKGLFGGASARRIWTSDAYWAKLEEIGWLVHLSSDQQTRLRARVDESCSRNPEYTYTALGTAWLDCECIDGEKPYTAVLEELSASTEGAFAPIQIREEWLSDSESFHISFEVAGRTITGNIPASSDWMQDQILDMVNDALRTDDTGRQFIALPVTDQTIFLVFVPPAIFQRAVHEELIPREA